MPAHQMMKNNFSFLSVWFMERSLAALFIPNRGDLYSRMVIMGSWIATLFVMLPVTLPFVRVSFQNIPGGAGK